MKLKINPKQEVVKLEKLLEDDFKTNFRTLKEIYTVNRSSEFFLKFFIKSNILDNFFIDLLSDHKNFKVKQRGKSLLEYMVDDYFSQDKHINQVFIEKLKENDLEMLQAIFFQKNVYESNKHVNLLRKILLEHDSFLCLAVFLNRISNEISSSEKETITFLKKTKFEDLFNLISYRLNVCTMEVMMMDSVISDESPELLKDPKIVNKILSSMAYPKVMEMIASKILNKKIELDDKEYKLNPIIFLFKVQKFGEKPEENKIRIIHKLFTHFKKIMELEELLTNLKYGEFKYNFSGDKALILSPKDEKKYLEFNKSGRKAIINEALVSSALEDYFSSFKNWNQVDYLNKKTEKSMAMSIESTISLLGEEVINGEENIKFKEMIWVISKLAERSRRMFGEKVDGKNVKGSMQKICFENMRAGIPWRYTNIRSKRDLIKASLEELKEKLDIESTPKKIISIFDFFATDINDVNNREIDLVKKPFIKIGDQYLWAYSSLAYKDLHKIITMNIFPNPQQPKGYITNKATEYENNICQMFKSYAFKAISQVKPQNSNDKDIDVLAYKDGYLFIVETKVTYSRHDYQSIKWHTEGALKKAEEQLNKRKESYKDYLDADNLQKLGIGDVSEIKKVIPIIVTNSFEGEVDRGNGIFKLHERELEMYLREKSSERLLKMMKEDYYWKLIKEDLYLIPQKNSFKDLEVITYV